MRTPQKYACLKGFEWNGNHYVPGLHYTDHGDEAHEPFREMAEEAVTGGRFMRVEGTVASRGIGAGAASMAGRGHVRKGS